MSEIKIIDSETNLLKNIIRQFKYQMSFDQKFFYFNEGANNYYGSLTKENIKDDIETANSFTEIIKKNIKKEKYYSFISLGCGNANIDKEILKNISKKNNNISYLGVDSSMTMIEASQNNMKKFKFEKNFLYADFSGENFKNEIENLIPENKRKIIALLGGTIGNVPQNYIANILKNTLNKGDMLLLDCRIQKEISDKNSNKFFKKYLKTLQDKKELEFLTLPLKKLNIPIEAGKINLEMSREKPINCLKFDFGFKIEKDIEIKSKKDLFILLKDDYINLFRIRVYDYNSLKTFFEKRDFKEIDKRISGDVLNIAFEKQ